MTRKTEVKEFKGKNEETDKNAYEEIYTAAKEHDANALARLRGQYGTLDTPIFLGDDEITPIRQLAQEGQFEAVKLLLEHGGKKVWAIYGAAIAGHDQFVKELLGGIYRGKGFECAVFAAACGNRRKLLSFLIDVNCAVSHDQVYVAKKEAVSGAVHGGHIVLVDKLLDLGADPNQAVYSASHDRRIGLMEHIFQKQGKITPIPMRHAVRGAVERGYCDTEEKVLHFLTDIKNHGLREVFAGDLITIKEKSKKLQSDAARKMGSEFSKTFEKLKKVPYDVDQVCLKAIKIARLIHNGGFSFKQACAYYSDKDLRNWFLIASSLSSNEKLSKDPYLEVASYLSRQNLSHQDFQTLGECINFRILDRGPVIKDLRQYQKVNETHANEVSDTIGQLSTREELLTLLKNERKNEEEKGENMTPSKPSFFGTVKKALTQPQKTYSEILDHQISRLERRDNPFLRK